MTKNAKSDPVNERIEAEKQRITGMVDALIDRLDLGWTRWAVRFAVKLDTDAGDDASHHRTVAIAEPDWEYRQATLIFYPATSVGMTDVALREIAIHEIAHVLIAPMWVSACKYEDLDEELSEVNELATENVARALEAALRVAPE